MGCVSTEVFALFFNLWHASRGQQHILSGGSVDAHLLLVLSFLSCPPLKVLRQLLRCFKLVGLVILSQSPQLCPILIRLVLSIFPSFPSLLPSCLPRSKCHSAARIFSIFALFLLVCALAEGVSARAFGLSGATFYCVCS